MKRVFTPGYVLYLMALLAGAAAAYRLLAPRFRPLTVEDMASPDYQDSPDTVMRKVDQDGLLHDLRPHAKATHDGIDYATNAAGLRDDHDYTLEKPPGTRRVILLGDSFVFRFGLRLEHTMTHHRAWRSNRDRADPGRVLRRDRGPRGTCPGRSVPRQPGTAAGPVVEYAGARPARSALSLPHVPPGLLVAGAGRPRSAGGDGPRARLHRDGGIIPELDRPWEYHPFAPLYEHVHAEMARHGFQVIDLYSLLEHYPNADLMLWGYDGHTNAFANRIIAHVLEERLVAEQRSRAR